MVLYALIFGVTEFWRYCHTALKYVCQYLILIHEHTYSHNLTEGHIKGVSEIVSIPFFLIIHHDILLESPHKF